VKYITTTSTTHMTADCCVSAEARVKLQERRVNNLVEESCLASARGEFQLVCMSVCLSVCLRLLSRGGG